LGHGTGVGGNQAAAAAFDAQRGLCGSRCLLRGIMTQIDSTGICGTTPDDQANARPKLPPAAPPPKVDGKNIRPITHAVGEAPPRKADGKDI
jgi:hypothetical protein